MIEAALVALLGVLYELGELVHRGIELVLGQLDELRRESLKNMFWGRR